MFGCIALGLALGGLVAMKLHRRRRWGYGHGCHGGWHGHHHGYYQDYGDGGPGPGFRGPWHLMAWLGTTPAQEKVIREEMGRMRERGRLAREEARGAKADLAEVLRADAFDKGRYDAATSRVESAWASFKTAAQESLQRVHETLDARQRERLADFLSRRQGGPQWGPFR
jgi:uncharacterized membrane protein